MPHPVTIGKRTRMSFSKIKEIADVPNLIELQVDSYKWFIEEGLKEVFEDISPIEDYTGNLILEFVDYSLDDKPKYDIEPTSYEGLGFTTYNIFPHWNTVKEDIKKKVLEYSETITPLNDGEFIEIEAFQAK